jgi:hypothetical protein
MYQIYCLTFKTSGKKYIGFTGVGVINRIHKHYTNAGYGIDSHLYRAIRLYGIEDVSISILFETENKEEALKKEKDFITEFNTIKEGYNESNGGNGGWSVPENKIEIWKKSIKKRTQGLDNPNSKNVTNQEIIDIAVEFFLRNDKKLTRNAWSKYCKEKNLPINYTKFRFGGGYQNFLKSLKRELDKKSISYNDDCFRLTYVERYKQEYNEKISKTLRDKNAKNKKSKK